MTERMDVLEKEKKKRTRWQEKDVLEEKYSEKRNKKGTEQVQKRIKTKTKKEERIRKERSKKKIMGHFEWKSEASLTEKQVIKRTL